MLCIHSVYALYTLCTQVTLSTDRSLSNLTWSHFNSDTADPNKTNECYASLVHILAQRAQQQL